MSYKSTTIAKIINRLYRNYFLPAIQRPFVWKPEQLIRLFDSLMKGYPISSFFTNSNKEYIEAHLTDSSIRNGYIDIESSLSSFFPADCFGDRHQKAKTVEMMFQGMRFKTDIRRKSMKTISPRKRFGSLFNQSLNAKAGDKIKFVKESPRYFTLTFIRKT